MNDGLPQVGRLSPEWLDFFTVLGTIGLVMLLAFFWALFIRKNGKRRIRRRKRKRRSRNPTLAERGGLPPVREGKKPDAPPPT
jgi:uncharacterized membrane protein YbhN (UPF0104 family)